MDFSQFVTPDLILGLAALLFPLAWHGAQLLFAKGLEKLPSNVQPLIDSIVGSAVHAVEQTSPDLKGEDKKGQAMEIVQKMLAARKISLTPDEISVLIEEAVFLMNGSKAPSAASTPAPMGFHG